MRCTRLVLVLCLVVSSALQGWGQKGEGYHDLVTQQVRSNKLSSPDQLRNFVVDGKLQLSLHDAVLLALENNTSVRIQEAQVEFAKVALLGTHQLFDPLLSSSYNINSASFPPSTALQGTGGATTTAYNTTQTAQINYSQRLVTGTNFLVGLSSNNSFTNNTFNFFNPAISSSLNFQFTQPLLRNGWLFANRAPLTLARRNLTQSRASFAAQVSDSILAAVNQYWAVVAARGSLDVAKSSLDAAEATYKRDKRSLELGALPPLDIYRSESQVASRRVQVIQSEYALKQMEDALRLTVGADQDEYYRALDIELTEKPEPEGELRAMDAAAALQEALTKRPEFEAVHASLANDETRIRLAHNHSLPELDLSGIYTSNGLGGTQFDTLGQRTTSSSFNQLFGFGYPTYGAQLSVSLPIRNRGAQAEMGSALVSRRSDLYSERQLREQVTLDVSNAVHQLEQTKISMAAAKEAVELARKNVAAEQRKYELGSGQPFFVLEAQTELAGAQQSLLQTEVGYQMAVAAVDHATGDLLEPYHVKIADLSR